MTGIDPSPFLHLPSFISFLFLITLGSFSLSFPFIPLGLFVFPQSPLSQAGMFDCASFPSLRWHSLFSVPSKVSNTLCTRGALTPLYPMHL